MILNIHSDAAYLVASKSCSRSVGFFLLVKINGSLINGPIHVIAKILKNVLTSASEAEIGALFSCVQKAVLMRVKLIELGHP